LKGWVLQTSIQIKCLFMHHHIWCPIHDQVLIPIEHIVHVNILIVKVLIVKICLTQFDYKNKITYKTLPKLGKFNQFIQHFKHGHDTKEPQQYFPSHKTI
jgi:hypothetical protein